MPMPKLQLSLEQSNAMRRKLCEIQQSIKNKLGQRNTFGDKIIIIDEVLIYEGNKLKFKSKAHIVNQGLIWLINLLSTAGGYNAQMGYSWGFSSYSFTPSGNSYIRLGTGTGVTTGAMTALITPVATVPSSQSGTTSTPSTGTYRISWIATWNAGVLTAITVTEIGLWLAFGTHSSLQSFGWTQNLSVQTLEAATFLSRLSSSDGDFSSFVVNPSVPLTIEWRLTFTFA
jgi:hypothetical protein